MSTILQEPDSKLDTRLNELGDIWVSASDQLEDAMAEKGGAPNPHRPLMVAKAFNQQVKVSKTYNFMLSKGVTKSAATAWAEKAIAPTRSAWGHGYISPGVSGLFYEPMNPNIMNALLLPQAGLDAMLPEIPTNEDVPLYGIITGQTAGSGSAPANDCAPWGTAGLTKLCRQVATLGRVGISTDPISLERLGHRVDRADFLDYNLIGNPLEGTDNDYVATGMPGLAQGGSSNFLNDEFAKAMREADVEALRRFARDIWTSNPSNSADGFHTAWFRGLDMLINTGQQDSVTQTACARADSKIVNFAQVAITGVAPTNISTNANAASVLVDTVSQLWYVLNYEAGQAGLAPVEWAFVMAPGAFREVTGVWPCSYLTNSCLTGSASTPNVVMAPDQLAMREDMRKNHFLWIDAQQVPVILDPTITETQGAGAAGAGTFTSNIYLVPLTVRGKFPVLLKTYFDFNGPKAAGEAIRLLGDLAYGTRVSPDGKWLVTAEKTGACYQFSMTKRPGLVLRTPYLAARITNVAYRSRIVTRSWDPSAPSFYENGGVTTGTGPSYFNPTSAG